MFYWQTHRGAYPKEGKVAGKIGGIGFGKKSFRMNEHVPYWYRKPKTDNLRMSVSEELTTISNREISAVCQKMKGLNYDSLRIKEQIRKAGLHSILFDNIGNKADNQILGVILDTYNHFIRKNSKNRRYITFSSGLKNLKNKHSSQNESFDTEIYDGDRGNSLCFKLKKRYNLCFAALLVFALCFFVSCGNGSGSSNNGNGSGDSVSNFGKLGSECYPNKTCDEGLICDKEKNLCIEDSENPTDGSDTSSEQTNDDADTMSEQNDDDPTPTTDSDQELIDDSDNLDNPQEIVSEDVVPESEADKIQEKNRELCLAMADSEYIKGTPVYTEGARIPAGNGKVEITDKCQVTFSAHIYAENIVSHFFDLAKLNLDTPHKITNITKYNTDDDDHAVVADIKIKNMVFKTIYRLSYFCLGKRPAEPLPYFVVTYFVGPPNPTCQLTTEPPENLYQTRNNKIIRDVDTDEEVKEIQAKNEAFCNKMPNSVYSPRTKTQYGVTTVIDICETTVNDKLWTENVIPFLFNKGGLDWTQTQYRMTVIEKNVSENSMYMEVAINGNMFLLINIPNADLCVLSCPECDSVKIEPSAFNNDNCIKNMPQNTNEPEEEPSASLYHRAKKQKLNMAQSMLWTRDAD